MPNISDHDTMVYINISVKPFRQRPLRRKITLWKHADMAKLRSDTASLSASMISSYSETTPVECAQAGYREHHGIGP